MSLSTVAGRTYTLEVTADGVWAYLSSPDGQAWAQLSLIAAFDTTAGPDETVDVMPPEVASGPATTVTVRRRSTCWDHARVVVECNAGSLLVQAYVEGRGALGPVSLLGGRSLLPGRLGALHSGSVLPTLFSPNPEDPRSVLRSAGKPAVIGVTGDSLPGRGHWFFTPAPLYLALADGPETAELTQHPRGWLGLGLVAPVDELDFTELAYVPVDQGFHLELAYEGHRQVDGQFSAPSVLVMPGVPGPYQGLELYHDELVRSGAVSRRPRRPPRRRPSWWSKPMFCGWGAQCHLAGTRGTTPQEECTAANYDRFLDELAGHGLSPPTVVIDDGWQSRYGVAEAAPQRWPDLRGWIAERHRQGQRALLWWKAWDPEGIPEGWCITTPAGTPVAIDPGHEAAAQFVQDNVARMLSTSGLDADGLKVDFTARTPSGYALRQVAGSGHWGISLLHQHLAHIYAAAKAAKPDALIITHAANPGFADIGDMVRLNDMLRLDEANAESPLATQMSYRAAVVRGSCPGLLIDTDDWCAPNLEQWRQYLAMKSSLGVPALYYTTHLDRTGEALEEQDYAALRTLWAETGAGYVPQDGARKEDRGLC